VYTISARMPYGVTADCRCATIEELVEYLVAWLPMSTKVVCRDTDTESEE
jgi:hypothetical protein